VDVVLPCLDEAEALPWVLERLPDGYRGIVVDNGSTDGSAELARRLGALVVTESRRGFGAACHAGLLAATAEYVCFCDCDASLDPSELPGLVGLVEDGTAELVLGRRRPTARGAWPLHARIANAELARRLRARTGADLHDLGPMRAARREHLLGLGLGDRRSGYPLEMVLSAAAAGMRIVERDVAYRPRAGRSKVTGTLRGTRQAVQDMGRQLAAPAPVLLVLAKAPVPGRVKTRLTPACTPDQAAALAEAALSDTLRTLDRVPAGRRILVLDGAPGHWLPPGWEVLPQGGGGLDERLASAFAAVAGDVPALLVGMDTPQLTARMLAEPLSAAARTGTDAWFAPAADGGFWALGLARPRAELARRLLHGVPMSTDHTGADLLQRLAAEGLRVTVLPTLTDVDTVTEAAEVAAAAPRTRFASQWRTFATPAPAPAGVAVSGPAPSAAGPAAGPVPAGVAR
jgi:rSAM/selenodomain-associated transferase 1